MVSLPRSTSTRYAIYSALARAAAPMTCAKVISAVGSRAKRSGIDNALSVGVSEGHIVRTGQFRDYSYSLAASVAQLLTRHQAAEEDDAAPLASGVSAAAEDASPLAASLRTVCSRAPANRTKGTIAQALRVVLCADVAMPLDELFMALPMGWSRTDAISGLREGVLDGWIGRMGDGYHLLGDPPEERADDPLSVVRIPHQSRHHLEEIGAGLHALLSDAVRERRNPALLRALASAGAEVSAAMTLLDT